MGFVHDSSNDIQIVSMQLVAPQSHFLSLLQEKSTSSMKRIQFRAEHSNEEDGPNNTFFVSCPWTY